MAVLGSTPGIIVGVGVGAAASAAIEPLVEPARQQAWSDNPYRLLNPATLARLVAQGGIDLGTAQAEARRDGYGEDKVNALVYLEQTVPGFGELVRILRRDPTFAALFAHALAKQGLDSRYVAPVTDLANERLDPAVIANAIVRGLMAAPFDLPKGPPTEVGKIPAFPMSDLDTAKEAAAGGLDKERLRILTGIDGRPMSPEGAAHAVYRGIIERVDYERAVAEGDVRTEWADAIFDATRAILTPHEYTEAQLRGWIKQPDAEAGAARSGMTADDYDLLVKLNGRPISFHQVFIGERRGGTYDGPTDALSPAFLKSLQESNLRPEWYNLAWAQRYSYPSAFVLRALTQSGDISQADAHQILLFTGWEPTLAEKVSKAWATGTGASVKQLTKAELLAEYEGGYISDAEYTTALEALGYSGDALLAEVELGDARRAKAFRDRIVKAIHDAYLIHEMDESEALVELGNANITADAANRLLELWAIERRVTVRTLTPAQIAKAYKGGRMDQGLALSRLESLGYSTADATELLSE